MLNLTISAVPCPPALFSKNQHHFFDVQERKHSPWIYVQFTLLTLGPWPLIWRTKCPGLFLVLQGLVYVFLSGWEGVDSQGGGTFSRQ